MENLSLESIISRINAAVTASPLAKTPPSILAASKNQSSEAIERLIHQGIRVFGENRVQEALEKWPVLKTKYPHIQLHLIGPLQTNKVREAVALFDVIETLDRPSLARALHREMDKQNTYPALFIQVNIGKEPQKSGVMPEAAEAFIHDCQRLSLPIGGLMCIPPQHNYPAPYFALLRKISVSHNLPELSMGMSDDFEDAIRFGATEIRLGRILFGERTT